MYTKRTKKPEASKGKEVAESLDLGYQFVRSFKITQRFITISYNTHTTAFRHF